MNRKCNPHRVLDDNTSITELHREISPPLCETLRFLVFFVKQLHYQSLFIAKFGFELWKARPQGCSTYFPFVHFLYNELSILWTIQRKDIS